MPDPEIVRKAAEALQHHLPVNLVGGSLCLCDVTRTYEGPVGQRLHAAAAVMAVAEPLIRERALLDAAEALCREALRAKDADNEEEER